MKRKHTQALDALNHLLQLDFKTATMQQMVTAEVAAQARPGVWTLILAVKDWASELAAVCRKYVGKSVEIHADRGEPKPIEAALETVVLGLCQHLWLPTSETSALFSDDGWPEQNAVREFVLHVSGAPVSLIDGKLVGKTVLPRSEPKSRLGRRIADLSPTPPEGEDGAFLTFDESQKVLRGLEQSFRNALFDDLQSSYSEALLANYRSPTREASATIPPKLVDLSQYFGMAKLTHRQEKILRLHLEHKMKAHQIAKHLDLHHSTVQEHIRAGMARVTQAVERGQRLRRAARQGVND